MVYKELERTALSLANTHATQTLYWRFRKGVAIANGYPINPGGAIDLSIPQDDVTGEIWVIATGADTGLRIYEGFG